MSEKETQQDIVSGFKSPISLRYRFAAGTAITQFLTHMKKGKIIGHRSSVTGKVIVPPRGACPETGQPTTEVVELGEKATVIMFTVVHLPIPGNPIEPPFIIANLCFDDADQTFIHLISECENSDIHIGSRVKAVWKDESEWDYSFENIQYFVPIDEPLVDIAVLKAERLALAARYQQERDA